MSKNANTPSSCKACGSANISSIGDEWRCWDCGEHSPGGRSRHPRTCKWCGSKDLHVLGPYDRKAHKAGKVNLDAPYAYYCNACLKESPAYKQLADHTPRLRAAREKGYAIRLQDNEAELNATEQALEQSIERDAKAKAKESEAKAVHPSVDQPISNAPTPTPTALVEEKARAHGTSNPLKLKGQQREIYEVLKAHGDDTELEDIAGYIDRYNHSQRLQKILQAGGKPKHAFKVQVSKVRKKMVN